jgi:hypothetical protein
MAQAYLVTVVLQPIDKKNYGNERTEVSALLQAALRDDVVPWTYSTSGFVVPNERARQTGIGLEL